MGSNQTLSRNEAWRKPHPGEVSVAMLSLGCPKNLVDSEVIMGLLRAKSYRLARHYTECDVAIINTCAFIEDARKESIDQILELAELKKTGKIRALIVSGCLPQKYYKALQDEIHEIDALVGTGEYHNIDAVIESVLGGGNVVRVEDTRFIYDHSMPRYSLTPAHFKYIKIAEGCDHRCTFCIIPQLRGDYRSRSIPSILQEVKGFVDQGMKEANLISQDTSYYGRDIGGRYLLPDLLKALNEVEGLGWIRLLYNHPFHMTDEILDTIDACEKVCKYVDIPLQHISDSMLKSMKRGMLKDKTVALIQRMREKVSGLSIRTTFIVGYPGETEDDFKDLYEFVAEMRFDRLGVFTYSQGDDQASQLPNPIPEKVKKARKDLLMRLQQRISLENNQKRLGHTLQVLIDEQDCEGGVYRGRSYQDAPEVDGQIIIPADEVELDVGQFYSVRITESSEYDLIGEIV